jgi:ubiquinone/menaquinone biosynthesis C-methylase UbiE
MPSSSGAKQLVARGYDQIAERFLEIQSETPGERKLRYFGELLSGLSHDARLLDLGCGSGMPNTAYFAERLDVVGADISRGQLALARRLVPRASFVLADMGSLQFAPESFDAVAAMYSIIHLPREEHAPLLANLHRFLKPGGRLLAVAGANAWEGSETNWLDMGAEMWWSHFDARAGIEMLERSGFRIVRAEIEPDQLLGEGHHLFALAEKPA